MSAARTEINAARLHSLLNNPVNPRLVLDTDAYNEIDDQFAITLAALCPDTMRLEAVYAAPFHNSRAAGPADGMEKSYNEIRHVLSLLGVAFHSLPVLRGCTRWLEEHTELELSPAVLDLIDRARPSGDPLYVVCLGAPTNVATALSHMPELADRIVVVWLGGHPLSWPTAREFNLEQDVRASRILLDSGVPLILIPCELVAGALSLSAREVDRYVAPMADIGRYLQDIFRAAVIDRPGSSRIIWDLAAVSWICNKKAVQDVTVASPLLTDALTWSVDARRHLIRVATSVDRDSVYQQLFERLAQHATSRPATGRAIQEEE